MCTTCNALIITTKYFCARNAQCRFTKISSVIICDWCWRLIGGDLGALWRYRVNEVIAFVLVALLAIYACFVKQIWLQLWNQSCGGGARVTSNHPRIEQYWHNGKFQSLWQKCLVTNCCEQVAFISFECALNEKNQDNFSFNGKGKRNILNASCPFSLYAHR